MTIPRALTYNAAGPQGASAALADRYQAVRSLTQVLTAQLSAEDQMVQSCGEASPTKWHQAHTSWFFETFVLRPLLPNYKPFREEFRWLFNSYYNSLGEVAPEKFLRASFSRPSLDRILSFRAHVDAAMEKLLSEPVAEEVARRIVLGINHEQQHQELLLTDIKHAFYSNSLRPAYKTASTMDEREASPSVLKWNRFESDLTEIGCTENPADCLDFCFDNETPRHRVYVESFRLASRCVTCSEYLDFMSDDAYARAELWLSDGWVTVRREQWRAPLYWERDAGDSTGWRVFTLRGWRPLSALLRTAVCHVSFYEAEAFARWKRCRLPGEAEWELTARELPTEGNTLETQRLHPAAASGDGIQQLFGDCWEWTASPYTGYPGYSPPSDAMGEYNGKFMSGQMILRGGSCVTPATHLRATYRNFFQPATRWQFTGIRLAC